MMNASLKENLMKIVIALATLLFSSLAFADKDYTAKVNEDGKYCARVEVAGINGITTRKRKCRTIEQWEAAGYIVSEKKSQEG